MSGKLQSAYSLFHHSFPNVKCAESTFNILVNDLEKARNRTLPFHTCSVLDAFIARGKTSKTTLYSLRKVLKNINDGLPWSTPPEMVDSLDARLPEAGPTAPVSMGDSLGVQLLEAGPACNNSSDFPLVPAAHGTSFTISVSISDSYLRLCTRC